MEIVKNGVKTTASPEDQAEWEKIDSLFRGEPDQKDNTARIAELEARLSQYEDNERATNILLGVTE